ncbi:uncharacterized protein BO97DRAFT_419640 [Aspergillus homomorphus CBS 101889]|uniref:Uncharacterized protein n=1 Tax=Aspergillus homomorphus (strain CBS 101889) TaxID=1450537 RepID=A0A395IAW8_ASPHC|nr:hypothetical protein BO97DRAFT_419640 [Aspergillus homomorphus CBS 101889]RAL17400.1 hypothetical protein BO97DRAFT_419640 [Aspergillus homomorphus CBS 101889]
MARNKNTPQVKRHQWTAQPYQEHASQPAALLVHKNTARTRVQYKPPSQSRSIRPSLSSPTHEDDEQWEEEVWPDWKDLVVRKCRNVYRARRELASLRIRKNAVIQPSSDKGAVVLTSRAVPTLEPELRYIVYVTFAPNSKDPLMLPTMGRATAAILDHIPAGETVGSEFCSAPNRSLSAVLSFYRELMNSRPIRDPR